MDHIERYNIVLDIWTSLKVKMPVKLSNHFVFAINSECILLMGGMKRKQEDKSVDAGVPAGAQFELESRVFVFKTSKQSWKDLKPFPFKKKFANIVYNNHGKFFCMVLEQNTELPQVFVYDVRAGFPQFDRYWQKEKLYREGVQRIRGKDIRIGVYGSAAAGYQFTFKQEKEYGLAGVDEIKVNEA